MKIKNKKESEIKGHFVQTPGYTDIEKTGDQEMERDNSWVISLYG